MAGKRLVYAGVGLLATGLAVLGVWLPVLPTTPFVLLALWAFAQSSARLSAWLRRIPVLRRAIRAADDYRRERTLPLSVKLIAQSAAWASVVVVALTTRSLWFSLSAAAVAAACTVFMVRTPTRRTQTMQPAAEAASLTPAG